MISNKEINIATVNLKERDDTVSLPGPLINKNKLVYFDKALQARVFRFFDQSLTEESYIGSGSKKSI